MSSAVGICKFTKLTLRNRLTPLRHNLFYQFLRDKNRVKTRPSLRTCLPFATFLVLPIKGKVRTILSHFPCFFFRSVRQAVNRYSKNKYCSNNYHLASSVVNAKSCSLPPSRGAEGLQLFVVHFRAVLMKQGLGDGADDYRQFDRQFVEILHKQNWAASMDLNLMSFIFPWWHIKRCLQFRRNSNLHLSSLFSFTFLSWYTLTNSSRACGKRREILKSWNAAISKYIQLECFCCVREKLLFFNMWNLEWSNRELL